MLLLVHAVVLQMGTYFDSLSKQTTHVFTNTAGNVTFVLPNILFWGGRSGGCGVWQFSHWMLTAWHKNSLEWSPHTGFYRLFRGCVFVSLVFTDSSQAVCLFHWFSQTVNKLYVCFTGFHRLFTSCVFVSESRFLRSAEEDNMTKQPGVGLFLHTAQLWPDSHLLWVALKPLQWWHWGLYGDGTEAFTAFTVVALRPSQPAQWWH